MVDSDSDRTPDPDVDRVQDQAEERQHERAEHVETTLAAVREDLGNQQYPVTSEELAATYADRPLDLPNETESIGSVFDRIEDSFEDERAAYEAFVTEFESGEHLDARSDSTGPEGPYWSEERAETQHEFEGDPIDDDAYESSVERSRERARQAQADDEDDR